MADNPRVAYNKLGRHANQLHKMTTSTSAKVVSRSTSAIPATKLVTTPTLPRKSPATAAHKKKSLFYLEAWLPRSTTSSFQAAGVQTLSSIKIGDCKLCLSDHHVTTACPIDKHLKPLIQVREQNFPTAIALRQDFINRNHKIHGRGSKTRRPSPPHRIRRRNRSRRPPDLQAPLLLLQLRPRCLLPRLGRPQRMDPPRSSRETEGRRNSGCTASLSNSKSAINEDFRT